MLIKRNQSLQELLGDFDITKGKGVDLFSSSIIPSGTVLHECYWGGASEILSIPMAVVPADNDLESFFADISTYHPQYSPITAYSHVFRSSLHSAVGLKAKKYNAPKINVTEKIIRALVSLVIGESAARNPGRGSNEKISYHTCRRTFAYALARAYLLYPKMELVSMLERWATAHELVGIDPPIEIAGVVLDAVRGITSAGNVSLSLADDLVRGLMDGARPEELLPKIGLEFPEIMENALQLRGAFDRRMKAFQGVAKDLLSKGGESSQSSIILAFLANTISPGSFSYVDLLRAMPHASQSIVWYAVFSGLSGDNSVAAIGNGIGYKIARDLTEPFSLDERPSCDISLEELIVLSRLKLTRSLLKPQQPRELFVALMPGINSYMKFPGMDADDEHKSNANAISAKDQKLRRILVDALRLLDEDSHAALSARNSR